MCMRKSQNRFDFCILTSRLCILVSEHGLY